MIDYDDVVKLFTNFDGQRIRLTWPHGAQRVGVCSTKMQWTGQTGNDTVALLNGQFVGGEIEGATRFESMLRGRYRIVRQDKAHPTPQRKDL